MLSLLIAAAVVATAGDPLALDTPDKQQLYDNLRAAREDWEACTRTMAARRARAGTSADLLPILVSADCADFAGYFGAAGERRAAYLYGAANAHAVARTGMEIMADTMKASARVFAADVIARDKSAERFDK